MKEAYYFSHDYNPTSDPKIQALIGEYGATGYGIYWRIVEMLHEDDAHKMELKPYIYIALAKQLSTSVEQVREIVQQCINVYELFVSDEYVFWSERVMRNIDKRSELSSKRSKAGKISAENRKNATHVQQESTHVEQNSTKERKGKEIKEKEIIENTTTTKESIGEKNIEDSKTVPPIGSTAPKKGKNNISDREKIFYDNLVEFIPQYGKDMIRKFFDYWAEKNKSGTKMKFEMQQTFEISRRLATWHERDKGFDGSRPAQKNKDPRIHVELTRPIEEYINKF